MPIFSTRELKHRIGESKDTYRKKLEEKLGRNKAEEVWNKWDKGEELSRVTDIGETS